MSYLCNSSVLGLPFTISNCLDNLGLWLFKPVNLQFSPSVLAAVCSADYKMASRGKPFKHRYHLICFTSLIKVIGFPPFSACVGNSPVSSINCCLYFPQSL